VQVQLQTTFHEGGPTMSDSTNEAMYPRGIDRRTETLGVFDATMHEILSRYERISHTVHLAGVGHTSEVTSVCVTPDGKRLVTGSHDGTTKIWDIATGALLGTCYNVEQGFLWSTPPEDHVPSGWFWTNRGELVVVMECNKDGSDKKLVTDKETIKAYFRYHNRQEMVMSRIDNFAQYKQNNSRLQGIRNDLQSGREKERLMIECGPDFKA
jgi:WD40 repeat protein